MNAFSLGLLRVSPRAVVLGLTLSGATAAWATPTFPSRIRAELELSSLPSCELCHQGTPAIGTVVTPFGTSMRARGLLLADESSLRRALATMESEVVDSDGDGTPDIAELKAGEDPNRNDSGTGGEVLPDPRYGCGAEVVGGPAMGLLGGLWLLLRRRR